MAKLFPDPITSTLTRADGSDNLDPAMPRGVVLEPLRPHVDERGAFTEIFRNDSTDAKSPVQWNLVDSQALVLRGVHVHVKHDDYLLLSRGRVVVGLHDLRQNSATYAMSCCVELTAEDRHSITIPHGVAHGFLFLEPSQHLYAVTHFWDPADELGCHWSDPELKIEWPVAPQHVSRRDREAQSLVELKQELEPFQARLLE